ncbi:uncharacterized protein LOC113208713 [Frankliniella occidentalis]|uniref:Uncharacterized protein LOC113208713 n=1 Tax=Frankliniella occidentalis TaxID=133901 RepID=A0A6J1SQN4_FRAOC|nr:uncharacterized protein LOC113208713 [Frankliniella occidentalis]
MDEIHKRLINRHIIDLKRTHYERLIHAIERLDKENKVIPPRLLSRWKELRKIGYTESQANEELYCEIQKRGPKAFQLLADSLNSSGQNDLACLLDPTLRVPEADDDDDDEQPLNYEYYDDDGVHFFHLDETWNSDCYEADRIALKNLFLQLGFTLLPDNGFAGSEALRSLVVINFCALDNGGVVRENAWLEMFSNQSGLYGKPKILMSIRYKGMVCPNYTAQDSGTSYKAHKDILQLQILVTPSERKDGDSVSEEMKHLINIFGREDSLHIKDKVKLLNQALDDAGFEPVISLDSDFSKRFCLDKKPLLT